MKIFSKKVSQDHCPVDSENKSEDNEPPNIGLFAVGSQIN